MLGLHPTCSDARSVSKLLLLPLHCFRVMLTVQDVSMSCRQVSPGCRLVVYHRSNTLIGSTASFGVPTSLLSEAKAVDLNITDAKSGRIVIRPLLLFHGGPECNVQFDAPVIQGVKMTYTPSEPSQVCTKLRSP